MPNQDDGTFQRHCGISTLAFHRLCGVGRNLGLG